MKACAPRVALRGVHRSAMPLPHQEDVAQRIEDCLAGPVVTVPVPGVIFCAASKRAWRRKPC
jgi:hypothetical protein